LFTHSVSCTAPTTTWPGQERRKRKTLTGVTEGQRTYFNFPQQVDATRRLSRIGIRARPGQARAASSRIESKGKPSIHKKTKRHGLRSSCHLFSPSALLYLVLQTFLRCSSEILSLFLMVTPERAFPQTPALSCQGFYL